MKSPKKGKRKGKGKKKTNENDVMHQVDKAFYELQIVDLNRKLARQRGRVIELEEARIQLESKLGKMDEDRGDIIAYLKRNLTDRNTEVTDLQAKVASLTEMNALQEENHQKQLEKLEEEYNNMREHLISKVKMLTGQLNALEDYRLHREELLQKYEDVQNALDTQELYYKKLIYEMEKKSILGKANLKHEMEEKMFKLAIEFQQANGIRIAASSQRIIRENIAMNNEMNYLITETNELDYENLLIRKQFRKAIADLQLIEEGNKKTVKQFALQAGVIQDLTEVNLKQKEIIEKYEEALQRQIENQRKLQEVLMNEEANKNKMKTLQTQLNAVRYSEKDIDTRLSAETNFRKHLEALLIDVRLLITSTIIEHPELIKKVEIPGKPNLLKTAENLLLFSKSDVLPPSPYDTVSTVTTPVLNTEKSRSSIFPTAELKPPVHKVNIDTYMGVSFEDFLKQYDTKPEVVKTPTIISSSSSDYYIDNASEETLLQSSSDDEQTSNEAAKDEEDVSDKHSGLNEIEEIQEELEEEEEDDDDDFEIYI